MPIAYPVHYVTKANEILQKLALDYDVPDLSDTQVRYSEEAGSPARESFYILRFKWLFLAKWKINFEDRRGAKYQEVLQILLGSPPFSVHMFDKWWTVERLAASDDNLNDILDRVSLNNLETFADTGDAEFEVWKKDWITLQHKKSEEA